MLRRTRLLATTLVVMILVVSQSQAQRNYTGSNSYRNYTPQRKSQSHRARYYDGARRAPPRDTRREDSRNRNRRVQHVAPMYEAEIPPMPPRVVVAQNPLDELQRELERAAESDSENGLLDDLNDLSDALRDEDENVGDLPQEDDSAIDEILGGKAREDDDDDNDRNPLSALDDAEDADQETRENNPGLRDDSYYRSLGAPRGIKVRTKNQPLTMANIFGEDDDYDCECMKCYCEKVWACAGGRCQGWFSRYCRDRNRNALVRNATCNNCTPYRTDCKCPKVRKDQNEKRPVNVRRAPTTMPGGPDRPGDYMQDYSNEPTMADSYDGEYYDGEYYDEPYNAYGDGGYDTYRDGAYERLGDARYDEALTPLPMQ